MDRWVSEDPWNFKLEKIDNAQVHGTKILITNIHEGISSDFQLQYFINALKKEVSITHSLILNKGFKISINGENINPETFDIKYGENLTPEIKILQYKVDEKIVNIKIYAGVSSRDINKGGWNIFCNDRLIVHADKSDITGWQYDKLPKYHPDYAYFRGYVIFDSEHADLLPWTTTKTGLNSDSEIYKIAFFEMKKMMKNVISSLKNRAKEDTKYKNNLLDSNPLTVLIDKTPVVDFLSIKEKEVEFTCNAKEPISLDAPPAETRIQYSKLKDDIEFLQKYIGVGSGSAVGSYTFDYFIELARSDDE